MSADLDLDDVAATNPAAKRELDALRAELAAYRECEKLAAPLSCVTHGLVPNLASFDNKCPNCERDRLLAQIKHLRVVRP